MSFKIEGHNFRYAIALTKPLSRWGKVVYPGAPTSCSITLASWCHVGFTSRLDFTNSTKYKALCWDSLKFIEQWREMGTACLSSIMFRVCRCEEVKGVLLFGTSNDYYDSDTVMNCWCKQVKQKSEEQLRWRSKLFWSTNEEKKKARRR